MVGGGEWLTDAFNSEIDSNQVKVDGCSGVGALQMEWGKLRKYNNSDFKNTFEGR